MGISKRGPIIEEQDRLLMAFTDGSSCESDGQELSYTTLIHLVCSRGSVVSRHCLFDGAQRVLLACLACVLRCESRLWSTPRSPWPRGSWCTRTVPPTSCGRPEQPAQSKQQQPPTMWVELLYGVLPSRAQWYYNFEERCDAVKMIWVTCVCVSELFRGGSQHWLWIQPSAFGF